MPTLSNRVVPAAALALAVSIVIILVTLNVLQNGSYNPLAVLAAGKTIFLHEKPEANLMYNKTGHSYFNMQGNVFHCGSTFDGSIYYQKNDTHYFKCIDRGTTQGEKIRYQIVP